MLRCIVQRWDLYVKVYYTEMGLVKVYCTEMGLVY